MPVATPSLLDVVSATNVSGTLTSNSISPTGNGLLFISAHYASAATGTKLPLNLTTTLSGVTFTKVGEDEFDDGNATITVGLWRVVVGGSPGSGTITVATNQGTCNRRTLQVFEVPSGFNASAPIKQAKPDKASGNPFVITYANALDNDSLALAIVGMRGTTTLSKDDDYTQLNQTSAGSGHCAQIQYVSPAPDTTVQWGSNQNRIWAGIVIEIDAEDTEGNQTISCSRAALSSAGQTAGILPGSVAITTSVGALSESGITADIQGVSTVVCGVNNLNVVEHDGTIIPGAVIVSCQTGVLNEGTASLDVIPGEAFVSCALLDLLNEGHPATLLNSSAIVCGVVPLSVDGTIATVEPGAIEVQCSVGSLSLIENASQVEPGAVTITCLAEQLISDGHASQIVTGGTAIACQVLGLNLDEHGGVVEAESNPQTVSCSVEPLGIGGYEADIIPGAVSVTCLLENLGLDPFNSTISGEFDVQCGIAALSIEGRSGQAFGGDANVECSVLTLTLSGERVIRERVERSINVFTTARRVFIKSDERISATTERRKVENL